MKSLKCNMYCRLMLLMCCPMIASAVAAMPQYSGHRLKESPQLVGPATNIGDVNGDGTNDIALSGTTASSAAGLIRILSGADRSVIGTVYGDNAGDYFGASVASIGDVANSDGRAEFVVSAPNKTSTCPGGVLGGPSSDYQGYVRGFSFNGSSFSTLYTVSGATNGGFGLALADIGDENADGKRDFIVTAPYDDRVSSCGTVNNGKAYVFSGTNGNLLRTHTSGNPATYFYNDVANVGDIDADGKADYAIAYGGTPTAVYKGSTGALLFTVPYAPAGYIKNAIAGIGDVNGDTYGDVIVGDSQDGSNNTGAVKVFSGYPQAANTPQPVLATLSGRGVQNNFGRSVANLGDLDGDSVADFGVLAGSDSSMGATYIKIYSGASRAYIGTVLDGCPGETLSANAEFANISGLGDIDGDSKPDFVVGAMQDTAGLLSYLFLSADHIGGETCDFVRIGNTVVVL